ncbi:MAG: hypothetical protein MSIBF_06220 [Candidatus Altiarchaeales archaeon IMC4]|nr:MAG: hypothetical protein MSIBF_06220 [Candidatus Altiarchaeales archaeon IMC4]
MNNVTLDTTVLAKGIIPPRRRKNDPIYAEQFRLYTVAKSIIREVETGLAVMNIPSVAIVEIAAVGARLTGKEGRGILASEYVRNYGHILHDVYLLDDAVRIAAKTKISGFDSVFIACARITDSTLITDDKGMYDAALKAGIRAKLLRNIQ